jgi:hypothetical protein
MIATRKSTRAGETQPAVAPHVDAEATIDLKSLSREALHKMARDRGVVVHPNAGAPKVLAALGVEG